MKMMTKLGVLALMMSATGPNLTASETGDYAAFKLDGISNYSFAYGAIDKREPAWLLLTGDMKQGFDIIAIGETFGPDVKFAKAQVDRNGVVTKLKLTDNYIVYNGGDLSIDIGKALAQMTMLGIGETKQVAILQDSRTKFVEDDKSLHKLTRFSINSKTYGAILKSGSDQLAVQHLVQEDDYLLAKTSVGVYAQAAIKASIVDLTAANQSIGPASTAAMAKSTETGRGHVKQAVAAA